MCSSTTTSSHSGEICGNYGKMAFDRAGKGVYDILKSGEWRVDSGKRDLICSMKCSETRCIPEKEVPG